MRAERGIVRVIAVVAEAALVCGLAAGCKREARQYRLAPPAVTTHDVVVSELRPGGGSPTAPVHTPF
jgi:hypothetical protein